MSTLLEIVFQWQTCCFLPFQTLVSGSAFGLEGQVMPFVGRNDVIHLKSSRHNSSDTLQTLTSSSWLFIITMETHATGVFFQIHQHQQDARVVLTMVSWEFQTEHSESQTERVCRFEVSCSVSKTAPHTYLPTYLPSNQQDSPYFSVSAVIAPRSFPMLQIGR